MLHCLKTSFSQARHGGRGLSVAPALGKLAWKRRLAWGYSKAMTQKLELIYYRY